MREVVRTSKYELAAYHGQLALKQLACLKPSPYSQSLTDIVDYVLSRLY